MSQAKVEQHKKDKANRKKVVARQRLNRKIGQAIGIIIIVAIIAGIGTGITKYSINKYEEKQANRPRETYYVNLDDITNYISALDGTEDQE